MLTVGVQQICIIMKGTVDPDRFLTFHNNLLAACYNAAPHTEKKIEFKETHLCVKLVFYKTFNTIVAIQFCYTLQMTPNNIFRE